MKKQLFFLSLFVLTIPFLLISQTTLVLQPDASCGKDAYLHSLNSNNNLGAHPDFIACAWTVGGRPVTCRQLIDFDLSAIPSECQILSATLTLFGYFSPGNGAHWSLSGPNTSILQRVTSTWEENTVTWNTQPTTTTNNQIVLPASSYPEQDYIIDITTLLQDIMNDPDNSFGFMLRLETEQYYRRLVFASSDNSNPSLHPRMEITYESCNLELLNTLTCYLDDDGDGFGDPEVSESTCSTCSPGFVENGDDCNDADPDINPDAIEICDGIDNNCNGETDESDDQDGDGINDICDNCPSTPNAGQEDADCDGVGDACDQWPGCDDTADSDNDGIPDCIDLDEMANWPCGNNGSKVTVCHIPPGNPANRHDICINQNAVSSHLNNHGDYIGECDQIVCGNNGNRLSQSSTRKNNILVFPNPAIEVLKVLVRSEHDSKMIIQVIDLSGRVIIFQEEDGGEGMNEVSLDVADLENGIYFITIQVGKDKYAERFVKMDDF